MKLPFLKSPVSVQLLFGCVLVSLSLPTAGAQQTSVSNAAPASAPSSTPESTPASATATDQGADNPQLKLNPEKILKNWEPAADEEYQLGPGDEISLNVPGHAELATKYVVGPDGRITLPVAGTVEVANKTRLGASQAIKDALTPYYTDLSITLSIDKYGSNHILILGNVQHPGVLQYDTTPTLLDAIARGGLLSTTGSKDGLPNRCIIYRGNDESVQVDLRSLLTQGNALADMRLRRNDIVFIPAQKEEFVSVMGEVNHPGAVALTPEMSVHLAIADSGGTTDLAGKNVIIVQAATNKTITIPYKQLFTPNGDREITLHAGDIIAIPRSGIGKATALLQRISPVATMITIGAVLF